MSNKIKYVKLDKLSLKDHSELNENWVQERIAEDPSILGLGSLVLKDKERKQPRAGRLDLLLQDPDSPSRYEVELQLGKLDESHIIRAIEYWDIERKRFPNYDHTADIIAEDITSRFLNVISLFNGHIPLIAIQLSALKVGDQVALSFTTVLDQVNLGLDDEEEEKEVTDRPYWEKQSTPKTVKIADELLSIINEFDEGYQLKYNKFYIGLMKNGVANNFVAFKPKKNFFRMELRLKKSDLLEESITAQGLDLMDFDRWGKCRIRLSAKEIITHREFLKELMKKAHDGE